MVHQGDAGSGPEYFEARLEAVLLSIKEANRQDNDETVRELSDGLARQGMPPEYRMEGFHLLGLIELEAENFDLAFNHFEEARRIAVDLNDCERMALNQRKLAVIEDKYRWNPAKAKKYFALAEEYQAEADSGVEADPRFSHRHLDDD